MCFLCTDEVVVFDFVDGVVVFFTVVVLETGLSCEGALANEILTQRAATARAANMDFFMSLRMVLSK